MNKADKAARINQLFLDIELAKVNNCVSEFNTAVDCPYCVDCGAPIPDLRHEAIPGAIRCVNCQRIHEGVKNDER